MTHGDNRFPHRWQRTGDRTRATHDDMSHLVPEASPAGSPHNLPGTPRDLFPMLPTKNPTRRLAYCVDRSLAGPPALPGAASSRRAKLSAELWSAVVRCNP